MRAFIVVCVCVHRCRMVDVGGQRMQRPKWNLTGEISAVIFVCGLTEYAQARGPAQRSTLWAGSVM